MKKILLIVLLLLIILCGIFYKQIMATIDFYQYQQENAETFAKATITWKEMPFTSTGSSGVASEALIFGSLQFPVPFAATMKEGTDSAFALGGAKSITISRSSTTADFFFVNSFAVGEKGVCQFLTKSSGLGACTSNYNLYRTFLELNETDIHIFTSIADKELHNRIMLIRAETIPSNKISGFETSRVTGFLFTIDSGNYIAHLFDNQDQMYEVTFTNLEQADVAFVLSNTTVI